MQGFVEDENDFSPVVDDDENDFDTIQEVATTQFTFNPVSQGQPMTEAQIKLQIASLVTQYGNLKDPNAELRFIIGTGEKRKPPGRGTGEVDRFKRSWNKLQDFNANHNWRRILSNEFEGDYYDQPMPFKIDGVEWLTVYHYLVGMMYSKNPAYALLFSMSSKEDPGGFWSKVKAAKREHDKNMVYGAYPIDMEFPKKIETYLTQAWLAKFTQNPLAKNALLLTEDAVLAIRGNDGVLDMPLLGKIRNQIKANPTLIYRGPSVPIERVEEELPPISSSEELNFGYVDSDKAPLTVKNNVLLAGTVTAESLFRRVTLAQSVEDGLQQFANTIAELMKPSDIARDPEATALEILRLRSLIQVLKTASFIETEAIEVSECVIYLATGVYDIDIAKLISQYGHPKFISRHLYAMEKIGYDANSQFLIALQRTVVSQSSEYILINTQINTVPVIPISIYLEPFVGGFGIFIISSVRDNQVLDLLRLLTQISPQVPPSGV